MFFLLQDEIHGTGKFSELSLRLNGKAGIDVDQTGNVRHK
jgi:hypothetical protein